MAEYLYTSHPTKRKLNGKPQSICVHRLVWMQAHGDIPKGHVIHHKNGNKYDNRLENLECLSTKEHSSRHHLPNRERIIYPSGAVKVIKIDLCTKQA